MQSKPILINRAERPSLADTVREMWRYRELIVELTKRAVILRYKNSIFGIAWSLVTPLMFVFMITVVRKYLLRQEVPNYSAYLLPAMFAWTYFTASIPDSCTVLLEHAPMIRKVYFPIELLPIGAMMANLVHFLISMVVALIYLIYHHIFPWQVNWEVLLLLAIIPAQSVLILGFGYLLSAINVLFEDVRFIVTVVMSMMLYAVPLLYMVEDVAAAQQHVFGHPFVNEVIRPHLVQLYLLNPFASVLVLYQKALLPPAIGTAVPALPWSWALLAQTWVLALVMLYLGIRVFERAKWRAVERL